MKSRIKEFKYDVPLSLHNGVRMPVLGHEYSYSVNEYGVVFSLEREVPFTNRWGQRISRTVKESVLLWYISVKGYARVQLSQKHNGVLKKESVHKLVVQAFLNRKPEDTQINHEDGNKLNNHYSNLTPCDAFYNQQHASRTGLNKNKKYWDDSQSKPVVMYNEDGFEIGRFGSMCEAESKTNVCRSSIKRSCENKYGKRRSYKVKF